MDSGISILICTHNGAKRIEETLSHLSRQKFNSAIPWEIVLVDNASTDKTVEIAKTYWKSEVPLRILHEPKLGVAYARITGMNACQYPFVGLIDDDNWVSENWVEKAFISIKSHPDAAAIGGPSQAVFESPAPEWFSKYGVNFAVGEQYPKPGKIEEFHKLLWGAGLVARRKAWEYLYNFGFTPLLKSRQGKRLLSGEESEVLMLFKLMGLSLYYDPTLKIKHFMTSNRLHWRYYIRLKKSLGASSVFLGIYRDVINRIRQGQEPNPTPWRKEVFASVKQILRDPLALVSSLLHIKPGNHRVVTVTFQMGRFNQLMNIGHKYETLHIDLYKKYAPLKNVLNNPDYLTVKQNIYFP
ncbi:glycosyltransferase family 2 protein [bacterium]|nr:glycosyltransferase family 2 protein [bacterium]